MLDQNRRITSELVAGQQLTPLDWARALLATEINFSSDVLGAGAEWATVTGISDETAIQLLRSIQRKLVRIVTPVIGNGLGTRPIR
ncbi:MAG: hypothetical protein J2P18_05145 [Nocardia sp.]|nr:hypothetical protein [Nocardia sp.]